MKQSTIEGEDAAFEKWCEGYGSKPAQYMFVGISAGRLGAIKTRVPFTKDTSGRLLQRCLGKLGLSKSDEYSIEPNLTNTYITNFVKGVCLTDQRLNRIPTEKTFEFWWPTLKEEIEEVKPKIILALGKIVFEHLKIHPFTSSAATEIKYVKHPRWYASHGALANETKFNQMVEDYSKALKLSIT